MSYDISFRVKVEGVDEYIPIPNDCSANVTYNLRDMIVSSTGLEWKNGENNGLVTDILPSIETGLAELTNHPEKYKKYEAENGWGTVEGCKRFFETILEDWDSCKWWYPEVSKVATFWIV